VWTPAVVLVGGTGSAIGPYDLWVMAGERISSKTWTMISDAERNC